jgi:hypothetical protein
MIIVVNGDLFLKTALASCSVISGGVFFAVRTEFLTVNCATGSKG